MARYMTRDELDGIKPRKSFEDMQNNAREAAEHLMRLTGSTSYYCHLTPSASTKGNRPQQAIQKEYQSGRKGRDKPEFLDAIRNFIASELNGVVHLDQEADDGMAQANYTALESRYVHENWNSVIVSRDKDLRMVPGLHWDFDNETLLFVNDKFGEIYLDDTKKTKVLKGWGTKFFWAQTLMGDSADSIPGIPGRARDGKLKKMGAVGTYAFLQGMTDDKSCFKAIKNEWVKLEKEGVHEFTHWRTGEKVSATQALLGDMQLLWMRRNKNPLDVVEWIKEFMA